ncbi:MAG: amidinotransferase [Pseudobdellovibrio sp.]|jgi:hypothetical protein|nr:amidinotransferase [Pseudobdellovibrio sp.]
MVFPKSFCSNPDTISSNSFQAVGAESEKNLILQKAQAEFSAFQDKLRETGFQILSFDEDEKKFTPDALFPNNWFCHLPDGRVFLFPMYPVNRRDEYRADIIQALHPREIIDLRPLAGEGLFLEGTGSLILDHSLKKGFACLSPRTSTRALLQFSQLSGYEITAFDSVAPDGSAIYHTNVMMTMSPRHAVICMDSVRDEKQKRLIETQVESMGKKLVPISYSEMNSFAGNMLFIRGQKSFYWACSTQAYNSLSDTSRTRLQDEAPFVHSDLRTIETFGGGGARCLLAEYYK